MKKKRIKIIIAVILSLVWVLRIYDLRYLMYYEFIGEYVPNRSEILVIEYLGSNGYICGYSDHEEDYPYELKCEYNTFGPDDIMDKYISVDFSKDALNLGKDVYGEYYIEDESYGHIELSARSYSDGKDIIYDNVLSIDHECKISDSKEIASLLKGEVEFEDLKSIDYYDDSSKIEDINKSCAETFNNYDREFYDMYMVEMYDAFNNEVKEASNRLHK